MRLAGSNPSFDTLEHVTLHRRGRLCSTVFTIEARNFAGSLAIDRALLQICPFIMRNLPLPYAELGFKLSVFPVELQNDKCAAFHLRFAVELVDLVPMQQ